jgi:hypothetical protein
MMIQLKTGRIVIGLILSLVFVQPALSQSILLKGVIKDAHSDERIPFASMEFQKDKSGKLSDSAGQFFFRFDHWPADTLVITYVGYQLFKLPIDSALRASAVNNVVDVTILLERAKYQAVIVSRKIDRGLLMWRRIVRRKPHNDRYRFDNFSYELYNKLEVDIKNIKKEKLQKFPVIRKFGFVLNNIDTTDEGNTFLPVYLTEAISNYYYQKSPKKRREVFKGVKTIGVNNESVSKFMGGMDQNINFYSNFIPVFDKEFVSPISDNGDAFYRYQVLDTQYVNGRRLIHMQFTPKRAGQNTFEGDCWVHDTTWAIQKMNLRLGKDANINYVDRLSLIQEFSLLNDTTWFLTRDKFVVDLSLTGGKKAISAIGRKSTTYQDIVVNDPSVTAELARNTIIEETILPDSAHQANDSFWVQERHEELNKNEKAIYHTIDTLMSLPAFKRVTRTVNFLATGYLDVGNYQIGPWYNWLTYNIREGTRVRFDLGTNRFFNKKLILHGYLAYGFRDEEFKHQLDFMYLFNRKPRTYISASWKKDFDRAQQYYDEISQDNIFALAIRKQGVPIKFMMLDDKRVEFFRDTKVGFSTTITAMYKKYDPVLNLPPKKMFADGLADSSIRATEISIRLRYAYLEKFLENTFYRYSLGSEYPIVELRYTAGLKNVLKSRYSYHKITGGISDYSDIPPLGTLYYNVFAGRTFGKQLPYMLLDIAPGNELYYYNKYAFNLMNRYEFLHDRYMGINIEHNFGNGIFRFVPGVRKLKWRQFWSVKALWGKLSEENRQFNMPDSSSYKFESLNGKTYLEVGTGIDNIFKLFRIDLVWRVLPRPLPPENVKRFGVFGSFRLSF